MTKRLFSETGISEDKNPAFLEQHEPQYFDPTLHPPSLAPAPKQAVVLMRHGDRTPIPNRLGSLDVSHLAPLWESLLPSLEEQAAIDSIVVRRSAEIGNNAYARFVGSRPWGQLTSRGFQQCKAVGVELRRRYPCARVQAFSTDFPRTLASAAAVLIGFSPTDASHIIVRSPADEFLLPNFDGRCKRFSELLASRRAAAAAQLKGSRERLEMALEPIIGDDPLSALLDFRAFCVHSNTVGELDGISWSLLKQVEEHHASNEAVIYEDSQLVKLACGRLLQWVLDTLAKQDQDVSLLLAHDNMLTAFLVALGIYRCEWPVYASAVILETSDFGGHTKVRILVNDEVRKDWIGLDEFIAQMSSHCLSSLEYAEMCK